jgi:hypothetical protein
MIAGASNNGIFFIIYDFYHKNLFYHPIMDLHGASRTRFQAVEDPISHIIWPSTPIFPENMFWR